MPPPKTLPISLAVVVAIIFAVVIFYPLPDRYLAIPASSDHAHSWELDTEPLRQVFTLPQDGLDQLGLVFTPYGGEPDGDIILEIKNEDGQTLVRRTLPARQAQISGFTYFDRLNLSGLRDSLLTLEVSSSLPATQARLALRYQPDASSGPGSYLMRRGILYEGILAIELYRDRPLTLRFLNP